MKASRKNIIALSICALLLLLSGAFLTNINAQNGDAGDSPDGATVQHVKLTPVGTSTFAKFGSSVAISDNTAVVGGPNVYNGQTTSNGVVHVFVKNGSGEWTLEQRITVENAASNTDDQFGVSVAINGDTLFVGADSYDNSTVSNLGAVYVFTRTGTTWTQQQILTVPDTTANRGFGRSLAVSGDSLVVGSGSVDLRGEAHVFVRSGSSWQHQQKLTASDGAAGDQFGNSVGISGDSVIVGALTSDIGSISNQGSAYIFTRSGTTWTQQQKLLAADGADNDYFGCSVAISDNTAIIGAYYHDALGSPNQGAAYIYVRSGTTWSAQQQITAADGSNGGNLFGSSVAINGDTALVGAYGDDITPWDNRGAAYVFTRSGTNWTRQFRLFATDGAANDYFGKSVAMNGNVWLAGVPDSNTGRGSVYIFDGSLQRTAFDFDGDGKADVSVFRPSSGTWYLNQSSSGFSGAAFGQNGDKIAPADYDGDGKTDIAVVRNGTWYILRSQLGFTAFAFGTPDDIPVPGDYDIDGKDDIAVFRPSTGVFFLQRSTAGYVGLSFGQAGDVPVPADYDGDGRTDLAVVRAGVWRIQRNVAGGVTSVSFGESTDKFVPADYDGDGKADVAVFRPSTGTWYLNRSQQGLTGITFGISTDLPVPADYDGDGKADVAVFRDGTWYLNQSTNGFTGIVFGASTDKPAPNAFIQ